MARHDENTLDQLTDEKLDELVRRLVDALHPLRIYLFGSHARGTAREDSDVDLLVIVDEATLERLDADAAGYRALRGMFLAVELHIVGRAEFERRLSRTPFGREVLMTGRLLYAA